MNAAFFGLPAHPGCIDGVDPRGVWAMLTTFWHAGGEAGALRFLAILGLLTAPALVLTVLEFVSGQIVELRAMLRAAVWFPFVACVAAGLWSDYGRMGGSHCVGDDTVLLGYIGFGTSAVLFVVSRVAVQRARRLRKPLSPAPVS